MASTLYLAPTTDAVLRHIVERVRPVRQQGLRAPLTFLLPSGDAIRQLRAALDDLIGVRFLQFYNLSAAILSEAGEAIGAGRAPVEMSDLATRRLVRGVLGEMSRRGELTTFAVMLDKPGFVDVLVEWLREMKTQGIPPEAVARHAAVSMKPRDLQLAGLYQRYQAALRQADCADADGLLWLAADALEADATLLSGVGEMILAGFDQFSPVQLRTVVALANRAPLSVYLLWDEARSADSLALGRLAPTRAALGSALAAVEVSVAARDECAPVLAHVRRALFSSAAVQEVDAERAVAAAAPPSPEAEVRFALRGIKQRLLEGVRPEQVALLAPQPDAYRSIVAAVSREYGVPVVCETTLGENPCVAAFLNLLALAPTFPWRQTFDALRSPYVRQSWLDAEQVALLDALTRERPVIAGQDQWWHALGDAIGGEIGSDAADDEDRGKLPLVEELSPELVAGIRTGLAAFFAHLTPPPQATHAAYVAWIQDALLGLTSDAEPEGEDEASAGASLDIAQAAKEGEWAERDVLALRAMLQALRTWLDTVALAAGLGFVPGASADPGAADRIAWGAFVAEVLEWLPAVPAPPDRKHGGVRFGPLEACRAVTVDHMVVLGLGEGEFPRPAQRDPFYTAAERAAHPLPLVRRGSAEDASLWWQVLSNCRCSLTLLRSRFDASGAEWQPSPYWTAVVDLVEGLAGRIERPALSARPAVGEAASPGELLEALALVHAASVPDGLADAWRAVQAAVGVAAVRDAPAGLTPYEGVIRDAAVRADLARRYGPGRVWSVSRLNGYGMCPYAFWAREGLQLEALVDPAEGFDALQRGALVHQVLERLFARLAEADIAPGPDTSDRIAAILDEACDLVLSQAAHRYGFRPGPLWEHEQAELRAELQAYMAWECDPKQAKGFRPYAQELRFGLGHSGPPVRVTAPGPEGGDILLRGVVDRIDMDDAGRLRVIDYKTGSKLNKPDDIQAGRALQSALYAWVVETLMPGAAVVESCYRHTGARKESGAIHCPSAVHDGMVLAAADRAVQMAGAVIEGWFPAAPSRISGARACDEGCDYLGLCRVTRHGARKARREEAAHSSVQTSEVSNHDGQTAVGDRP